MRDRGREGGRERERELGLFLYPVMFCIVGFWHNANWFRLATRLLAWIVCVCLCRVENKTKDHFSSALLNCKAYLEEKFVLGIMKQWPCWRKLQTEKLSSNTCEAKRVREKRAFTRIQYASQSILKKSTDSQKKWKYSIQVSSTIDSQN